MPRLDAVATMKPNLVLLNIMLPKIDGFEIRRQIRANEETRHIPVIMLTDKKSNENLVKGKLAGADGCITKPST